MGPKRFREPPAVWVPLLWQSSTASSISVPINNRDPALRQSIGIGEMTTTDDDDGTRRARSVLIYHTAKIRFSRLGGPTVRHRRRCRSEMDSKGVPLPSSFDL